MLQRTPQLEEAAVLSPLTSQAAAIGWVYFPAIYFESPAPGDVDIGCFFNVDYVWGSGAWHAKEVGEISTIEASLKQRESKNHHMSLLQESISTLLCSLLSFQRVFSGLSDFK